MQQSDHKAFLKFRDAIPTLTTLIIGSLGALLMGLAGGPVPFLTGPALAITLVGLVGVKVQIPVLLRDICFIIIGISMGAGITPEVLQSAKQWPLSFFVLTIVVILIVAIGRRALAAIWKYDAMTALLAVIPGHLSYVLGLSSDTRGDLSTISIVQSIRILALTLIVPIVVVAFGLESTAISQPTLPMPTTEFIAVIAFSAVMGWFLNRLRLPAAYLIAGLVCSILGHITGAVAGPVINYVATPAFVVLGCLIGTRFSGVSWPQFRNALGAGLMATFIGVVMAAIGAVIVSSLTDLPLNQLLIAFSPGGVETMSAMSISMGVDSTFVAAHHVARLLILTFLAPFLLKSAQKTKLVKQA